jgi:hypothetical protein
VSPGDVISRTKSTPLRVLIPKLRIYECEGVSSPAGTPTKTMTQVETVGYTDDMSFSSNSAFVNHDEDEPAVRSHTQVIETCEMFESKPIFKAEKVPHVDARKSIEEIKQTYQRIRDEVVAETGVGGPARFNNNNGASNNR